MGVIDLRDRGPSPLEQWLARFQDEQYNRKMEEERQKREDDQISKAQQRADASERYRALRENFHKLAPEQQAKVYAQLPPEVQAQVLDPSTVGETAGQRAARLAAEKRGQLVEGFSPDQFQSDYIATEELLGRNPNAQYTETVRDRAYMNPEQFAKHAAEGFVPPSEVAKNRATAQKDTADATFTAGPRTESERAHAGLYRAQTGEAGAHAGLYREQTTTAQQERTPGSPVFKDPTKAGDGAQAAKDERALRTDFRKDYGPYLEADKMLQQAESYAQQRNGSGDQMLLIAALSVIDGSVTREGEVALARKTGSLPDRMRLKVKNWKEGDLLSDDMRTRIIEAAREAQRMSQGRRQEIIDYYNRLSDDYKFGRERVTGLAGPQQNGGVNPLGLTPPR